MGETSTASTHVDSIAIAVHAALDTNSGPNTMAGKAEGPTRPTRERFASKI